MKNPRNIKSCIQYLFTVHCKKSLFLKTIKKKISLIWVPMKKYVYKKFYKLNFTEMSLGIFFLGIQDVVHTEFLFPIICRILFMHIIHAVWFICPNSNMLLGQLGSTEDVYISGDSILFLGIYDQKCLATAGFRPRQF